MFIIDLQLFGIMPPDFDEPNPLLEPEEQIEAPAEDLVEAPEDGVEEVPIEDLSPETQPPNEAQPPQGQTEQQGQETEQPMPGEDFYSYMERMKADLIQELRGPEEQQAEGPTEEELAIKNKEWMDRFYENPMAEVERLAGEIASKQIEPLMKEREQMQKVQQINTDIEQFRQQHPDMEEYTNEMVEIFKQMPELESTPHALDVAYRMAKGNRYDQTPKSLNDYLQDEQSIEKLFEDETFRQKAAKLLMKHKKTSPRVLGSTGTNKGETVLNNDDEIKSMREATKAWLASGN